MPRAGEWLDLYDSRPKDAEKLPGAVALGVLLETLFADDAEIFFQREWTVADRKFVTNWRRAASVPSFTSNGRCTQAHGEGAAAHGHRVG